MEKKSYCTQNAGDCWTCSLVNYGRDCLNNPVNYADFEAVSGNDDKEMNFNRFFPGQTVAGARRPQFAGRHQSEKVISVSDSIYSG